MKFALFMSRPGGRLLRVLVGAGIVATGILFAPMLCILGAIVLVAGVFDWCLIAPLLRLPIPGSQIRARAAQADI